MKSVNPQKLLKPPAEDVLAVARALAILHARIHHDAEIARQKGPSQFGDADGK
jgi:hypothetical protein